MVSFLILSRFGPHRGRCGVREHGRVDGVDAMLRRLDAVDVAVRESTRLVREPRPGVLLLCQADCQATSHWQGGSDEVEVGFY